MAIFRVTPTTSVIQTPMGFPAFVSDTAAGPDTLIVEEGGFLMTMGSNTAAAALFNDTGAWTVTVNGVILSELGPALDFATLSDGTPLNHTINIGAEGSVFSESNIGVRLASSAKITNAGTLAGVLAIHQTTAATTTIVNTGIIEGENAALASTAAGSSVVLTNSGSIAGDIFANNLRLANTSGAIDGDIFLTGVGTITNSGSIFGSLAFAGVNNDTITNNGAISVSGGGPAQGISMGGGNDKLINTGSIFGGDVLMGLGNDSVTNKGTISNVLGLGDGNNQLSNTGQLQGGLFGGNQVDTVTNKGFINGTVSLGGGNDTIINNGSINDIDLGQGDDTYSGSGFVGRVFDSEGSDSYTFGRGGQFVAIGFNSHIGTDRVTGSKSNSDTYNVGGATSPTFINLDSRSHGPSDFPGSFGIEVAANSATNTQLGFDILTRMDHVLGSEQTDIVFGSAGANLIFGQGGSDGLAGLAGNDFLDGGAGNDLLIGGQGADRLTGGEDGVFDSFRYLTIADSGTTRTTRDTISDFEDNIDKIDLRFIDAITGGGDDAFRFIGANTGWITSGPGSGAGQVRSYWTADGHMIEADVNGDGKADLQINIDDQDHSIVFTQTDFLL